MESQTLSKNYQYQFKSILNLLKSNSKLYWIRIIQILLWFHRITGLTFGGLSIDSNGKTSVNKFFKFYGYLLVVLMIIYDIYTLSSMFVMKVKGVHTEQTEMSATLPVFIPYLFFSIAVSLTSLKSLTLFFFNIFGYKLFAIFAEELKRREMPIIGAKMTLVIIFSSVEIMFMVGLNQPQVENSWTLPPGVKFMDIVRVLNFYLIGWYTSSFMALIWIISIYYSEALSKLKDNLKNALSNKSGKNY